MALMKNKINVEIKSRDTIGQSFVRLNGWTYPFHWLQLVAWLFYLLMCLVAFALVVPTLPNTELRITLIAVTSLVLIANFITHVIAVNINPADDRVVDKLMQIRNRPTKFDRSKHSHVIENQFCYICETDVGSKSKHCSVCNKCVSDFDHHCKWLNNCVGGKNYRWFIVCILTATIGTVLMFVNCLILTIAYFSDNSWLYDQTSTLLYFNNDSPLNQSLQLFWISAIILSLVLSFIAFILLTHLLGFHLFLNCSGLSTYDFVVQQRQRNADTMQKSKTPKRSKLLLYMRRFKTYLTATIIIRKRVKPSDMNSNQMDKHSIKSISSSTNTKLSSDKMSKTYQNDNKDIEKGNNLLEPKVSESPKNNRIDSTNPISSPNFTEIFEKEKALELKNELTKEETIEEKVNIEKKTRVDQQLANEMSNSIDSFTEEPIFKPLNPSFGQNGRISRLSFTNQPQFVMPSLSPDSDLNSKFVSKPMIVRSNSYAKYKNGRNLRINTLYKNMEKSKDLDINALNKVEINSNA